MHFYLVFIGGNKLDRFSDVGYVCLSLPNKLYSFQLVRSPHVYPRGLVPTRVPSCTSSTGWTMSMHSKYFSNKQTSNGLVDLHTDILSAKSSSKVSTHCIWVLPSLSGVSIRCQVKGELPYITHYWVTLNT